jgi:hypothetical protein
VHGQIDLAGQELILERLHEDPAPADTGEAGLLPDIALASYFPQ